MAFPWGVHEESAGLMPCIPDPINGTGGRSRQYFRGDNHAKNLEPIVDQLLGDIFVTVALNQVRTGLCPHTPLHRFSKVHVVADN